MGKEKISVEDLEEYIKKSFISNESGEKFLQRLTSRMENEVKNKLKRLAFYDDGDGLSFYDVTKLDYIEFWDKLLEKFENGDFIRDFVSISGTWEDTSEYGTSSLCSMGYKLIMTRKLLKENRKLAKEAAKHEFYDFIKDNAEPILSHLEDKFSFEYVAEIIDAEGLYQDTYFLYQAYLEEMEKIKNDMVGKIPENVIDLFPIARQMKRRFVLHLGPTNSGKTYDAVNRMIEKGSGIYLGPLRLLAAEQFDKLNDMGHPCSLVTGEEKKIVEGALFQASTIEMADLNKKYVAAVIDEAQMIADNSRGGAWMNAILGLAAEEIHVCAPMNAEYILSKMIAACGDDCRVVYHERNTPLIMDDSDLSGIGEICKGDALIVFSKKSVYALYNDMKREGFNPSIIYGSLPYDVRQNEARKFASGKTDIVIATDAIGMGMNLPIRRVVFMETEKFNGKEIKSLSTEEILQIGGRAGRYGIFNEGYVAAVRDKKMISDCINGIKVLPEIRTAFLRMPESLIHIAGSLLNIIHQWKKMEADEAFLKEDMEHEELLCRIVERYTDNKKIAYDFITIPFDEGNLNLLKLWEKMLYMHLKGEHYDIRDLLVNGQLVSELDSSDFKKFGLSDLEHVFKIFDLFYHYNEKLENGQDSEVIVGLKDVVSKSIISLLEEQKVPKKRCKYCGKVLPWSHKYGVCNQCHRGNWF